MHIGLTSLAVESKSLREIQTEVIDLEERLQRAKLLRGAPPAGFVLFLALSLVPFGPASKGIGTTASLTFFVTFCVAILGVIAANEAIAGRRVRRLQGKRAELLSELEARNELAGSDLES